MMPRHCRSWPFARIAEPEFRPKTWQIQWRASGLPSLGRFFRQNRTRKSVSLSGLSAEIRSLFVLVEPYFYAERKEALVEHHRRFGQHFAGAVAGHDCACARSALAPRSPATAEPFVVALETVP